MTSSGLGSNQLKDLKDNTRFQITAELSGTDEENVPSDTLCVETRLNPVTMKFAEHVHAVAFLNPLKSGSVTCS